MSITLDSGAAKAEAESAIVRPAAKVRAEVFIEILLLSVAALVRGDQEHRTLGVSQA
jgi:hypothetical protein